MVKYEGAFLFLEPAVGEAGDEALLDQQGALTKLVWVADAGAAAREAAELAAGGVGLIELYRGFDLASAASVVEAVEGRSPVGLASFGFGHGHDGPITRSVTIYEDPAADPSERITVTHPSGGTTTVVGAPDPATAARLAEEFAAGGVGLVETCGGAPLTTAARVAAAVGERVAVSSASWPFESLEGAAAYKTAFADA